MRLFPPAAARQGLSAQPVFARRGLFGAACACAVLGFGAGRALAITPAAAKPLHAKLDAAAQAVGPKLLAWRRDIHQHPELGNQETRTAGLVAAHLRALGYEVRERVAVTGLVARLQGGAGPGPHVALRADMDALPVAEEVDLPFRSQARARWEGAEVPVMHACGHDCHTAILMAAAEVLAANKAQLKGQVTLLFQPAEEGAPTGETGGARRMLAEGAFSHGKPDAVFGLHVVSGLPAGMLGFCPGPAHASSDTFRIVVHGRQTHGARPWAGVDPIVIGAQVVSALQTIQSRQVDVDQPSVLTVGTFHSGARHNIVPEQAVMTGTLRTYDEARRDYMQRRVKEVAEGVASGMDGRAEVTWAPNGYPTTVNDRVLGDRMLPSLARVVGEANLRMAPRSTASEDFSYFAQQAPGMFFWVGVGPRDQNLRDNPTNHSPRFRVEEDGLLPGLRGLLHLVADYTGSAV